MISTEFFALENIFDMPVLSVDCLGRQVENGPRRHLPVPFKPDKHGL